jgi:hypothetical protein
MSCRKDFHDHVAHGLGLLTDGPMLHDQPKQGEAL